MNLLMVSGDRQIVVGERGPFYSMQREFSRYFDRIDVLCPKATGPVVIRSIHDNVHFHPADCGRIAMPRWIADTGARLIEEHKHALIVSHDYGFFYNGLGSAQLTRTTGVPYLSEIHHVPGHPVAIGLRERFDLWVTRAYLRWARHRAIGFRVVNQQQMPRLLMGWGVAPEKIFILPSLYIDLEVFHPPAAPIEHEYDVCFVGRLVENKGANRILKSLSILGSQGMPVRAVFVGKGPLADKLKRQAEKHGLDVTWIPWVDTPSDLAEIYRKSRVCVCASTCEGGPRFTVEAMACGTPVVSTPVGVMGDLLGDGHAGRLGGFDPWGFARSLEGVLRDEAIRIEMGRHAAKIARNHEYAQAVGVYANGLRIMGGAEPLEVEPEGDRSPVLG
jgi:glycosyltransferase involved in cell wall biosynthesis